MVLESLIRYDTIRRKPQYIFIMGFVYSSVAIILSLLLFKNQASLIMVFFTAFACFPFIYYAIKCEEQYDIIFDDEKRILKEHSKTVMTLVFLFLGFFISFTLWALILPETTTNTLFSTQFHTINNLNAHVTGNASLYSKYIVSIFFNNIKVLIFCIFFSFLYGAGAIFILTWNASVGGAFIGNFIKTKLIAYGGLHAIALGLVRYMPHGVLEMAAYFVGALAGGIISVAIIRHDLGSKHFFKIIFDSSELIGIAVAMLFVATLVEVFVTPNLVAILG
ncbi:stage II sporulation protein M [Candidatus Woesearchaeota archaeon]|nr:stage II sporulation protein M [Candidatus Woesearchaeota archaeon]